MTYSRGLHSLLIEHLDANHGKMFSTFLKPLHFFLHCKNIRRFLKTCLTLIGITKKHWSKASDFFGSSGICIKKSRDA